MLDLNYIRTQFPGLETDWVLMDNAGGSQMARPVLNKINEFLTTSHVQLGASYQTSDLATWRVEEAHRIMAQYINAADPGELIMGSATSLLVRTLAGNVAKHFPKGSEIIVTNCDHEANIGAWRELEQQGFIIKTWRVNPESWELELDELEKLLSKKTVLVAFTHTSNILGKINPVKKITQLAHEYGAWVCVDAVAYAPHRMIDVQDWDVDFYVFSFYKTYGPHYAMMYGKKEHLLALPGNNHFFIGQEETAYKFQPGHVNFEFAWGMTGLPEYFQSIAGEINPKLINEANPMQAFLISAFENIASHEQKLSSILIDFLKTKSDVRFIGPDTPDKSVRVPTISFVVGKRDSESIILAVDKFKYGIRFGDFYAYRLIDELGLMPQNGVIRISMVHYNTEAEINGLVRILDQVL